MGIFKKANNIYITVRDTYTSISGSSYEEAEEVIIEATNGDLELISQKKVIMQGLGKEDEEQEIEQSEPNNSDNEPNFFIHFRLPKKYDGDFGFDWLRKEYLPTSEGGVGICVSDINALKKEYYSEDVENPFSLRGKDYYCSFLNIIPNKKINLSLVRENLTETPINNSNLIIYFDFNSDLFEFSSTEINFTEVPLEGNGKFKEIEFTCKSPLTQNTEIKIKVKEKGASKDKKDPEVGKLMVMKNDVQYKLNVRFVEVKFAGKIEYSDSSYNGIFDFSKNLKIIESKNEIPSPPTEELYMSRTIDRWKEYIKNNENLFRTLLNQALIKYTPYENKRGNIDYKKITINFGDFKVGSISDSNVSGIKKIKKSIDSIDYTDMACILGDFLEGIREYYISKNERKKREEEKGVIIFLIPIRLRFPVKYVSINKVFEAYSDDIFKEGRYIMLNNLNDNDNLNNLRDATLIHEIAHTLGLIHSFPGFVTIDKGRVIPIVPLFKKGETNNVMDYINEKYKNNIRNPNLKTEMFFKWQWKIMQNDDIDLIPIIQNEK